MQATASGSRLAPPTLTPSDEPTTSSLLLSTLGAYSELTKHLFSSIENPSTLKTRSISDTHADKTWNVADITAILTALTEVDQLFSSRVRLAHQHAVNQAQIDHLESKAKQRDRQTRQALLELSKINHELGEIARLSEEEVASIERAEKQPVGHATLLAYAQRLARYTSAPPGYKLPQLSAAAAAATKPEGVAKREEATEAEKEKQEAISLGADYNQYAKRAAAYYDPAIPSMPQEMPFPSDAMMRQGILNSQAMLDGAAPAEMPVGGQEAMMEDADELPQQDFAASYSHLREQQRAHDDDDEEDAFDLDLN